MAYTPVMCEYFERVCGLVLCQMGGERNRESNDLIWRDDDMFGFRRECVNFCAIDIDHRSHLCAATDQQ